MADTQLCSNERFRLQRVIQKVLLGGNTGTRVFIDAVNEPGHDPKGEEEPQSPIPGHLFAVCHVLQESNDHIGGPGDIWGRLGNLPECGFQTSQTISPQP